MVNLIKLTVAFSVIFVIGWFAAIQYNPYNFCDDHPEEKMKRDYYICEPFGIEVEKTSRLFRKEKERVSWEVREDYKRDNKRKKPVKSRRNSPDCEDLDLYLNSNDWDEEELSKIPEHCLDDIDNLEF